MENEGGIKRIYRYNLDGDLEKVHEFDNDKGENFELDKLGMRINAISELVDLLVKRNKELDNRVKQLEEDKEDDIQSSADIHSY